MRTFGFILLLYAISSFAQSQTIRGTSAVVRLSAGNPANAKTFQAWPELVIKNDKFIDANGDLAINAFENDTISFETENIGTGMAKRVLVTITQSGAAVPGIVFPEKLTLGDLMPDQTKTVTIPIKATETLPNSQVIFKIHVREGNFDAKPLEIKIETRAFRPPRVIVQDALFATDHGGKITRGEKVILKTLIQNVGAGDAKGVVVSYSFLKPNINALDQNTVHIDTLRSGESRELTFRFITMYTYEPQDIPIQVNVDEQHYKYGNDTLIVAKIDQEVLAERSTTITPKAMDENLVIPGSLSSEVDKNIPRNRENPHLYGLVIGNEDYRSYQPTLKSESNVEFAQNDARIFKEYLIRTLGAPETNVTCLINATASQISKYLSWLKKIAEQEKGKAELVFYYSGHGYPDEKTKNACIIPVDVSATDLERAIRLADVYKQLTANPAKRVIVFLDACFSGAGRDEPLLALKSVIIKPNETPVRGNLVVMTSSSGVESSGMYAQEKHGLFTYFLLRKIQQTKGDISLSRLSEYVKNEVALKSLVVNKKDQHPQIIVSQEIEDIWGNWKLVE
jgi:hypothetical protein